MINWISVKEKLPDEWVDVLAFHENGAVSIQHMFTSWGGDAQVMWSNCDDQDESLVTHWQPLPDVPKGVSND